MCYQTVHHQPGASIPVKVDLLQNVIVADGEQHIFLQLAVIFEVFHCIQVGTDDLAQNSGVQIFTCIKINHVYR